MLLWGLLVATDTATLFDVIAGLHQGKIKCWTNYSCRAPKLIYKLQLTTTYYIVIFTNYTNSVSYTHLTLPTTPYV